MQSRQFSSDPFLPYTPSIRRNNFQFHLLPFLFSPIALCYVKEFLEEEGVEVAKISNTRDVRNDYKYER